MIELFLGSLVGLVIGYVVGSYERRESMGVAYLPHDWPGCPPPCHPHRDEHHPRCPNG